MNLYVVAYTDANGDTFEVVAKTRRDMRLIEQAVSDCENCVSVKATAYSFRTYDIDDFLCTLCENADDCHNECED